MAALTCVLFGCSKDLPEGVKDVYIADTEFIDSECIYRYDIVFGDGMKGDEEATYWVGFRRAQSNDQGLIIAYSSPATFQHPFGFASLTVDLTPTSNITPGEMMLAIAVRGDSPGSPADLSALAWAESEDPIAAPSFPAHCGGFEIKLWSGESAVNDGDCIFISNDPLMPAMTAKVSPGQLSGDVEWILKVRYTRSGRNDSDSYHETLGVESPWDITPMMGAVIRGGQATLMCHSIDSNTSQALQFGIRAYNPSDDEVIYAINNVPNPMWYYQYVAKREGGQQEGRWYLQFNERSDLIHDCGPSGVRYTPNSDNHGGFGIYQLTDIGRPPNSQELWDWRANVNTGTSYLTTLQNASNTDMAYDRQLAYWYFIQHWYMPPDTAGYVIFRDSTD